VSGALRKVVGETGLNQRPPAPKEKAHKKLKQRQNEIIEQHEIEKDEQLNETYLKVTGVENEEEAWEVIESFKEDLRKFHREELGVDTPPIELTITS
jgi:cell fate (sporulation/competence/biofilm development) regulator YmcA (YheA/YmcA/DUF963 family)